MWRTYQNKDKSCGCTANLQEEGGLELDRRNSLQWRFKKKLDLVDDLF